MRVLKVIGNILLVLLFVGMALGGLFAAFGLPWLDRVLADEVRDEFSLPEGSRVVIQRGSISQTLRGYVPRFTVDAETASLDGLNVEDLQFKAEAIKFDLSQLATTQKAELEHAERGEISFDVSGDSLLEFWGPEIEAAGLSKPSIELDDEGVKVSAVADLKLAEVRLSAKGEFEVDGSRKVRFRAREVEAGKFNFHVGSFKATFSKLTPILELDKFKLEIRVDELSTSDGYLHVRGNSVPAGEEAEEAAPEMDDSEESVGEEDTVESAGAEET